ncbi:MAG: metallophosphoesterase [Crenarchaeota archaeon]|nr:metallophosphoesterase [Thermoproteota archaeon]MCR8454246.1 metallophosphoesterase [Thermoproteota archaeon]MCR8454758.1 metallophosphoesterase [Thermoproteota archaeon]MCR8462650.1 metallophosphoesterase [Thermoproteota archaeon]MCR8470269.1 metallophosphoesterase [Thermoproteota archaeon]
MFRLKPIPVEEIIDILEKAEEVFKDEEIVLDIDAKEAFFIGDIHGDLKSATKIFQIIQQTNAKFVFLGDYIDRGPFSVEVMVGILRLKLSEPDRIVMLRGNHETAPVNEVYGFLDELHYKYPTHTNTLYREFNKVFSQMPVAAIINSEILCLHGGVPKDATFSDIRRIPKGDLEGMNMVLMQVLWNDPEEGIDYFAPSYRGANIYIFGEKAFEEFIEKEGLKKIIRAHTFLPQGARWYFKRRLLSLFSPTEYVGRILEPKIAKLTGKNEIVVIDISKV